MTTRQGGPRRKTRHKMRKHVRAKGKISINEYLQEFKGEDKVALVPEPAVQGGLFHHRFHGHIGVIVGKQGACYKVELKDGGMKKLLIVHPVHLRRREA